MGMALMSEGSTAQALHERMPIWKLRELARESHAQHTDEAARTFVRRVLDMEVERRTWHAHENPGYQPFSSTSKLGEHPGGGTAAADPLVIAYDRGIRMHDCHEAARRFIETARLKPRMLLAVLLQAAKTDRRVMGPWGKNYDQIADDLGRYAQMLGWGSVLPIPGHSFDCVTTDPETGVTTRKAVQVPAFRNGRAIVDAAKMARLQLILLAKV